MMPQSGGVQLLLECFLARPVLALHCFEMSEHVFQRFAFRIVLRLFQPLLNLFTQGEEKIQAPFYFVELAFLLRFAVA